MTRHSLLVVAEAADQLREIDVQAAFDAARFRLQQLPKRSAERRAASAELRLLRAALPLWRQARAAGVPTCQRT